MRRRILLAAWAIVLSGILLFLSCSDPLEGDCPSPSGPVILIDTLYSIDTLIVVVTDTTGSRTVCSRIVSNQQDIVWMFRNEEGPFILEFTASTESDDPTQKLSLDIDGMEFQWSPASEPELITEQFLNENTTIRIIVRRPPARGHAIDVCLTISEP